MLTVEDKVVASLSQITCERSVKMVSPTGPADLKLCVFYDWQSLHGLGAAPRLVHSLKSRGGWRPPGVSSG